MQATRLTLMCHGRTAAQKRACFPLDEPLDMPWSTPKGSRAGQFKGTPRLLCAPELRARQTAELFAGPATIVQALRDLDLGRWQGQGLDQVQQQQPDALQAWLADSAAAPHGGESLLQLQARLAQWLQEVSAQPGHLLAITHPWVIRVALAQVLNCPLHSCRQMDVEPLSSLELRFNGGWRLRLQANNEDVQG